MVTINVWDKSLVELVDKAIRESGLGINPQMNGTLIMLPIPELNEERRKNLVKLRLNMPSKLGYQFEYQKRRNGSGKEI